MSVRERPIIMQAESVRAILAGRKTQTRRVVKPQPEYRSSVGLMSHGWCWDGRHALLESFTTVEAFSSSLARLSPYGAPGDRLWVREGWGMSFVDRVAGRPHVVGGTWGSPARPGRSPCVVFRADDDKMPDDSPSETARWSSPMFMPRWASRLTLEITDVRVQRLQEISEQDAEAEGIVRVDDIGDGNTAPAYAGTDGSFTNGWSAQSALARVWDAINGRRFPWSANPWVWAVTFKRVEMAHVST